MTSSESSAAKVVSVVGAGLAPPAQVTPTETLAILLRRAAHEDAGLVVRYPTPKLTRVSVRRTMPEKHEHMHHLSPA